jgi:hypothetical protein
VAVFMTMRGTVSDQHVVHGILRTPGTYSSLVFVLTILG